MLLDMGSHTAFLTFNNLLEWLTDLRDILYIYQFIIKNIIKDNNEQADEEVYRVRSGRVLSFYHMELVHTPFRHMDVFTILEAL